MNCQYNRKHRQKQYQSGIKYPTNPTTFHTSSNRVGISKPLVLACQIATPGCPPHIKPDTKQSRVNQSDPADRRSSTAYWYKLISSTDQPELAGGDSVKYITITLWRWGFHRILYRLDPVHTAVRPAPGRDIIGRWQVRLEFFTVDSLE